MIIVPSRKFILPADPLHFITRVAGWFRLQLGRMQPDGTVAYNREYTFPNLILNQGLDRMGTNDHFNSYCQVGTGTTPPAATDTGLVSPIGSSEPVQSTGGGSAQGVVIGPPRYAYDRRVYRIPAGVGTGNLAEVGISWASGTGNTLYSRALILDGGGSPITITKLSDEVLDVTYELRTYIPTGDLTGEIVIAGSTHDFVSRAAEADQVKPQFDAGWGPHVYSGNLITRSGAMMANNQGNTAFTGNLATIDGKPSTTYGGPAASISSSAYANGTYTRAGTHTYGLGGNPIRTILASFGWCSYQVQFDPVIPKSASNQLAITFQHSWARRSI